MFRCSGVQVFRCSGVQVFRCSGFWMKVVLDESVIGRNGFGRKCFWMKVFLDEFFSNLDESVPNRHHVSDCVRCLSTH